MQQPTILSDDEFTVDGVVYTVTEFYQTSGTNRIYFAGIRSAEHAPWTDIADELKIGSTSLDIGYAFLSQGQNRPLTWRLRWSGDPGLDDVLGGDSLTDGTSISVTLISGDLPPPPLTCEEGEEVADGVCVPIPPPPPPTCEEGEEVVNGVCVTPPPPPPPTCEAGEELVNGVCVTPPPPPPTWPGAPTGLAATANGPSQIDLAWTAPASTGGSAITGYKIEVSPDGSSWSDLVADTGSTDTAYAHMGLDPATTRHYRVSAINAVGTSDASDSDDTTTASTNTAPTGAPTITGTAQVGQTLTASTTGIADADGLTSPTYTYQWIRVDGTEADIAAANSSTYILVAADLGTTLKVRVTFDRRRHRDAHQRGDGGRPRRRPTPLRRARRRSPGTAQVGQTLTAGTTAIMDADGLTSVSYTYQWIRVATDNTEANITSATASTYILVAADLGTTLTVRVTFADDLGHTETLTSAATATVTATPAVPTREPFEVDIVGVPEVAVAGESYELTAQSDEDSLVYAWRVDSGAIEPDDVQMVVWTAPETAGVAWIHVDVTREDDAKAGQSAYVRVEVPEPEPEPVPALPLLGQLLLALGLAGAGAMRLVRAARRP